MSDSLTASLTAFQATLSPQEQSELTSMERAAMIAETRDLLIKARRNKGGAMGTMSRQAQAAPPPQGAPPAGEITSQKLPVEPPPVPGAPPEDKTGQGAPGAPPPPPPQAPPVSVAAQAAPMPPAPPATPPMPATAEPADEGIEGYIDEKEEEASDDLSGGEMGLKEPAKIAAYVETYGHLRIRPTVKNALEVFDPNTNATVMLIRPNAVTRKNASRLRKCAVNVLATIAHHGLVKTAQMWKGQIKRATGGVVDYGTNVMQVKPKFDDESINDRGETTMQQDLTLGVDTTTGEGDELAAEEQPETRQPAGLSGKAAVRKIAQVCDNCGGPVAEPGETICAACKAKRKQADKIPSGGGILPAHETNMADPPTKSPEGNSLSSLEHADDNMEDKRPEKDKGSDDTLADAITTFANETLTAGLRRAQAAQPGELPMEQTGGCGGFTAPPKKESQDATPPMEQPMEQTAYGAVAPPPPPPISPPPVTAAHKTAGDKCPWCNGTGYEDVPGLSGGDFNESCVGCGGKGTFAAFIERRPDQRANYPNLTASKKAQQEPAAPGMGPDVLPQEAQEEDPTGMTDEQKFARLYRKRAEKQIAENTRKFIARFVRCLRVAARRQALNLEPNQLKIAVADALMTEAPLSKHEVYVPMDARTATFLIERGLDQRNALAFVDSLIKRSAAFMKMSDEALTQVEDDLETIQPVAPSEKEAQAEAPKQPSVMPGMPQMAQQPEPDPDVNPEMVPGMDGGGMPMEGQGDPGFEQPPPMEQTALDLVDWAKQEESEPEHQTAQGDPGVAGQPGGMELDNPLTQTEAAAARAAMLRRRAAGGNLSINTGIAEPPAPSTTGNSKRDQIRFAVGATKNAALHNYFGGRR